MVTYHSTFGDFNIAEICSLIHEYFFLRKTGQSVEFVFKIFYLIFDDENNQKSRL